MSKRNAEKEVMLSRSREQPSNRSPWGEGSLPWFILSMVLPPVLTIVGLISTLLLFGTGEVSGLLEEQRKRKWDVVLEELRTQGDMQIEAFRAELNRPALEYSVVLSHNPAAEFSPEVVTETIEIRSIGADTAVNVRVRVELGIPVSDEATVRFPHRATSLQYNSSRDAVALEFSALQVNDAMQVEIPLRRDDILQRGRGYDFLNSQYIVVTCDGGPKVTATDVRVPASAFYVIQPGENLFRVALRYGISPAELMSINGIENPGQVYAGQVLRIP